MFLKLLLSLTIIAPAFSMHTYSTHVQSSYMIPIQNNIFLISHEKEDTFIGYYYMHIQILQSRQSIHLQLDVKHVINITVINSYLHIVYKPIKSLYNNNMMVTEYIFMNDLIPGNYVINLVYNITDDAGLKKFYKRGKRQWFAAYIDTVGIEHIVSHIPKSSKAILPYSINIEYYPNYRVLSNIPIKTIEMNKNKTMIMTYFSATLVNPNYFVFITNLTLIPGTNENVTVDMWCRMDCAFAHEFAENITLYLFYEWKRLNETWQINHIVIPDFQNESIVNLGLILFRERDIIYNKNKDSVASKIKVAHFIAHKIIQEYFYFENPLWLSTDAWLAEAFVTFLGLYVINKLYHNIEIFYESEYYAKIPYLQRKMIIFLKMLIFQAQPNTRMMDLFMVQIQHESFRFDTKYEYNTTLYNTPFDSSFEIPHYIRASSLLRMLEYMLTEEIFWQGVRIEGKDEYINRYSDFFSELTKNLIFTKVPPNIYSAVSYIIKIWTKQKYYPVLKITRDYHYSGELIRAKLINVSIHNLNNLQNFYIPVTYTTQTQHNFVADFDSIFLHRFLTYGIIFHKVKENGWILFNIQQTGYYRVNYDLENWRRIASYLNSENYTKIHVLNRAQLIDDAFHLVIIDQLNPTVFWNITKYLSRETDYIAWYPMFKALEYLSNVFLFSEANFENIKIIIRNLLHDLLRYKLGYNEVFNDDDFKKSLRMEAAKWACSLDEPKCKERAGYILRRYLANSKEITLLPWWEEWTYCQGLKLFNYSLSDEDSPWWRVYHLGKKKFKPKLLKYLSCPEDSQFIKAYLNLIKNDSTTSITFFKGFSNKDYVNYFLFTIAKHARNPVVLDFILEKLENIRPKQVSKNAAFIVIINHVYSTKQLEKINDFLIDKFINAIKVKLNEHKKIWSAYTKERDIEVKTSELKNRISEEIRSMKAYNILTIQSKIQIRIFEIKSQKDYFQKFVK